MAKERPLLSIARKDLDTGPKDVRAPIPSAWLTTHLAPEDGEDDRGLSASTDGRTELHLTPAGGDNFLLKGHVHATIDTTCGRCLGPASVPVDAEITLLLVPSQAEKARTARGKRSKDSEGEFEFDADEADVATYEGETIVLDDLVREALLLELPISPLCSEDCAGMRSDPLIAGKLAPQGRFGGESLSEPGLDPRLAKLASLRDQLKK